MTRIDEIVDGIYRICTPVDVGPYDFQFNQFLIDDERPALIHTGMYGMYDDVRAAVREVVDPGTLEYVALLHFESDECGGMDRFLEGAPSSALREEPFAYRGKVLGRELPPETGAAQTVTD